MITSQDPDLAATEQRRWRWVWLLTIVTFLAALFAIAATGCTTVTPAAVEAHQASWDGADQTSGILRAEAGGFVVTARFVERYDALVRIYGDASDRLTGLPYFSPALTLRYGLSQSPAGEYALSPEAMTYFVRMNQWRRAGRQPK
jgi:hypothetical protein